MLSVSKSELLKKTFSPNNRQKEFNSQVDHFPTISTFQNEITSLIQKKKSIILCWYCWTEEEKQLSIIEKNNFHFFEYVF